MSSHDHTIAGHTLLVELGQGACGETLLGRAPDGALRAIKVLKPMGINRRLLQAAHARLAESEGHPGVVPAPVADFDARPAWIAADYHGAWDGGTATPATLAAWMLWNPSRRDIWQVIRQLAEALAFLHRIGVAHANLHPRNVLVTSTDPLAIAVTDFSQGWVSGVYQLDGNDAMLYASPEQLRDPAGMDNGAWGGWDVHAFGMLAFRLLNGRFPIGDDARRMLEARQADQGIAVTPAAALTCFPRSRPIEWDGPAADWEESARRKLIEDCLSEDPDIRFNDMREVLAGFGKVDEERELLDERRRVLGLRRREVRALGMARALAAALAVGFGISTIAALVFAHHYHAQATENRQLRERFERAVADMEAETSARETAARRSEAAARAQAAGAARESSEMKQTLIRSQEQADALFAVVRDRKPATHPGFKDLAETAAELEKFYAGFLQNMPQEQNLEVERARALSNLAELAEAREDNAGAAARQQQAADLWETLLRREPGNADYQLRLARGLLKLGQFALLQGKPEEAAKSVARASALYTGLAKEKSGDPDAARGLAACLLQQGRIERKAGHNAAAFAAYRGACEQLRALIRTTGRFDYRSALAASYVELAEFSRGVEDMDNAADLQRAALGQLLALVEEKPEMRLPRLDLARAYGELGESECAAGGAATGRAMLSKAIGLLDALLAEEPGNKDTLFEKALRLSALAKFERDEGMRMDAEKHVAQARAILAGLREADAANLDFIYQDALVRWQSAELAGDLSQTDAAIDSLCAASRQMEQLAEDPKVAPPMRRQIAASIAYLTGDLGYRLEDAGRKDEALAAFQSAATRWKAILADGENAAATDALDWCQGRIGKLHPP